jgi:hypothetical protein
MFSLNASILGLYSVVGLWIYNGEGSVSFWTCELGLNSSSVNSYGDLLPSISGILPSSFSFLIICMGHPFF